MTHQILSISALCASYGSREVLSDVHLTVAPGDWLCLHGPNGSGKTTLLRCVTGQMTPTSGSVHIGGNSLTEAPERARQALGYGHAPETLPNLLTGYQCLEVYAAAHDLPAVHPSTLDLSEELGLTPALSRPVNTYSLGMRQKLSLLLALVNDPGLLVLDEAFNGLDPASARTVKRVLRERVVNGHCAVILATHALDITLHYATRAALLMDGRLIRVWERDQLQRMRTGNPDSFEESLAEAVTFAP